MFVFLCFCFAFLVPSAVPLLAYLLQPISFDVPTIDVALQTVADNDVKLLLGFQRRFDSNFRTIREKVKLNPTQLEK